MDELSKGEYIQRLSKELKADSWGIKKFYLDRFNNTITKTSITIHGSCESIFILSSTSDSKGYCIIKTHLVSPFR